jgi:nitrous oxidase accessory protein NosD
MVLGMLLSLLPSYALGATIFVNQDGSGQATTIQAAVQMAGDGDTLIIEPGQYREHVVIKNKRDLTIRPLLDIVPQSVVIQGVKDGSAVVELLNCTSVSLSGVRITGEENSLKNGVSVTASSALIQRCSIENAVINGLYIIRKSTVELLDNQIFGNYTGALFYESKGVVRYCRIFSNRNNGLLVTKKSRVSAVHNTFHQNRTTGVLVEWASRAIVRNNIFSANGTALQGGPGQISCDYNLYDKNGSDHKGVKKGAHDLFADPLFKDVARFDFSLEPGSPAKNSDSDGLDRGATLPH